MKKYLLGICVLFCLGAATDTVVTTPAYSLKLGPGWVEAPPTDPEQVNYFSPKENIYFVGSAMILQGARPEQLEKIANKLRDMRIKAEEHVAAEVGRHVTVAEPLVAKFADGYQVAYWGHDDKHREFRYLGIVSTKYIASVYVESPSRSQQDIDNYFNTLLKSLVLAK